MRFLRLLRTCAADDTDRKGTKVRYATSAILRRLDVPPGFACSRPAILIGECVLCRLRRLR